MKNFKALLPVGGESAIERVLHSVKSIGITDISVVTGFQHQKLQPIIESEKVIEVYNPDFDKGMFTSIQAGTEAMKDAGVSGFLLMPVDCPVVKPSILDKIRIKAVEFADAGGDDAKRFIVPCYLGKKGHPLYVPICYAQETIDYSGTNGFKHITDKYDDYLCRMETGSESVILDMDDYAGYQEVLQYLAGGCREEKLSDLAAGHRFILVRHGQIVQHKDKIFLGQTDVPLSKKGIEQAEKTGSILAGYKDTPVRLSHIYTSDLSRAYETACIIAEAMQIDSIIQIAGFREISLGEWDGKYIEDIKTRYPEAFERRGRDLFKFKFDHNSENFYDLQYRVLKSLKKILKEETAARDILIVAHKGVLRVISNALAGLDVSDDSCINIPNGGFIII